MSGKLLSKIKLDATAAADIEFVETIMRDSIKAGDGHPDLVLAFEKLQRVTARLQIVAPDELADPLEVA